MKKNYDSTISKLVSQINYYESSISSEKSTIEIISRQLVSNTEAKCSEKIRSL